MTGPSDTALVASFRMSSPVNEADEHKASVRGHAKIVDAIEAGDGKKAAEYFRLVPATDKRFLQSRVFLMLALKQQLDDEKNKLDNRSLFVVGPDGRIAYHVAPFRQLVPAAYEELAAAVDRLAPPADTAGDGS